MSYNSSEVTSQDNEELAYYDFCGARIAPSHLMFINAYEGKKFYGKVSILNISRNQILVQILNPSSTNFTLVDAPICMKLSPGLKCSFQIVHTYTAMNKAQNCWVPIYINDTLYNLSVVILLPVGYVECKPRFISFDRVNNTQYVYIRTFLLYNRGYKTSKFEIDQASDDINLVIHPHRGVIPPKKMVYILIEFVGSNEGVFTKDIWVKCNSPFRIPVYVNVITPLMRTINGALGENFSVMNFAPIYGECTSVQSFKFSNFNTLHAIYVVLPELNSGVVSQSQAEKIDMKYKSFTVNANEGVLRPDEEKTISFTFSPLHDKHIEKEKAYFVAYRIVRLDCTDRVIFDEFHKAEKEKLKLIHYQDAVSEGSSTTEFSRLNSPIEVISNPKIVRPVSLIEPGSTNFLRICMYGLVQPVKVSLMPQEFHFGNLMVNTKTSKTINIHNRNPMLSIYFKYKKTLFIEMNPSQGKVPKLENMDLTITVNPRAAGKNQVAVTLELYYPNQPVVDGRPKYALVGNKTAYVDFTANVLKHEVEPKFNPGITPQVTNEVGIVGDGVKFNSLCKKPRAAMMDKQVDPTNALIAFPNDRTASLRPWTNALIPCKTIFAKMPRVITEVDEYMLSKFAQETRKQARQCCNKFLQKEDKRIVRVNKIYGELENKSMMEALYRYTAAHFPEMEMFTKGEMITQLTPMDIYEIRITPNILDAGKVAYRISSFHKLAIKNGNTFPINISMEVTRSGPYFLKNLPTNVQIPPGKEINFQIEVFGFVLGRYNTIINLIINHHHCLPIGFQVTVCHLCVTLEDMEVTVDPSEPNMSHQLTVKNNFSVPISFVWSWLKQSCFVMEPMSGTIPPNRAMTCAVYYQPEASKRTTSKLVIYCENGSSQLLFVALTPPQDSMVELAPSTINFPHLPLNLVEIKSTILINCGYDPVLFVIRNPNPFPGVNIEPTEGYIEKRSVAVLHVSVVMKALINFKCSIEIDYRDDSFLTLNISGNVDVPKIQFTPTLINMKRIAAEAITSTSFLVKNVGESRVHLRFSEEDFPELEIFTRANLNWSSKKCDIYLEPNEKKQLFLKYSPLDICMDKMYMPIIVNYILGPAFFANSESMQVDTYVRSSNEIYKDQEDVMIYKSTRKIPLLQVNVISSCPIISLSDVVFKFRYQPNIDSMTVKDLYIRNASSDTVEFCIRIDELLPNFRMKQMDNTSVEFLDRAWNIILEKSQMLWLQIEYVPSNYGQFLASLPIFIKGYNECQVFNYIKLVADFQSPLLACDIELHLEPIPLDVELERNFVVRATNHLQNCKAFIFCKIPQVQVTLPDNIQHNKTGLIRAFLTFKSSTPVNFKSTVDITCSCGSRLAVKVCGCVDTSMITTHALPYLTTHKDSKGNILCRKPDSVYPLQADIEDTEYYEYMNTIINVLEKWLFEQVLGSSIYCSIPNGLSTPIQNYSGKNSSKKAKKEDPSKERESVALIRILVYILNKDVPDNICKGPIPKDNTARIIWLQKIYNSLIELLESHGAFLPSFQSRYLMTFDDYETYVSTIVMEKCMTKKQFQMRATQCWVDVLLQIIKCLVLRTVVMTSSQMQNMNSHMSLDYSFQKRFLSKARVFDYCSLEKELLKWLTRHYNKELETLRKMDDIVYKDFKLKQKNFSNYTTDLVDGLALIAVTLSFCPYLYDSFEKIYLKVDTLEKALHNAGRLVHVLKQIRCTFQLTARQIVNPCAPQMHIFVAYMHEVFPHFNSQLELELQAELSSETTGELNVMSPSQWPSTMSVVILGDPLGCFGLADDALVVKVPPQKKTPIQIVYRAKSTKRITATLVLCGDSRQQLYAKSMVYTLVGIPTFQKECQRIPITIPLYTIKEQDYKITSPFAEAVQYDIYYSYIDPGEMKELTIFPLDNYLAFKRPRFMFSNTSVFITDSNGFGLIHLAVCSYGPIAQDLYLFFLNKHVGDFFIKFHLEATKKSSIEFKHIIVDVPFYWQNARCVCGAIKYVQTERCPRWLQVQIPCGNEAYLKCVTEMFMLQIHEDQQIAWRRCLESDVGPMITRWLVVNDNMKTSTMILHLLKSSITYNISTTNPDFMVPETVTIDVHSSATITMRIHVKPTADFPLSPLEIKLISSDLFEIRFYKIVFHNELAKFND